MSTVRWQSSLLLLVWPAGQLEILLANLIGTHRPGTGDVRGDEPLSNMKHSGIQGPFLVHLWGVVLGDYDR